MVWQFLYKQAPYLPGIDLSRHPPVNFLPALTDLGVCSVYNGQPMARTYDIAASKRVTELNELLDGRAENFKADMITGYGEAFSRVYWLNLKDQSLKRKIAAFPRERGSASVGVGHWMTYFNVRMSHVKVRGGQEVTVMIKPQYNVATEEFKRLDIRDRECSLRTENMVGLKNRKLLHFYLCNNFYNLRCSFIHNLH